MIDTNAQVAALTVKVEVLEKDIGELKADVKALLATVNQSRGGWRVILLVASVAGTMGALLAKLTPLLGSMPR